MGYRKCDICGANYPAGHMCMNCVNSGRLNKGDVVNHPKHIISNVSLLEIKDNDTLVIRCNLAELEIERLHEALKNSIKQKNVSCIFIDKDSDIFIIRKGAENGSD